MDTRTLVAEQLAAGAKLIEELGKTMPLQAAFWTKNLEDGEWTLNLVCDEPPDGGSFGLIGEVVRIFRLYPEIREELDAYDLRPLASEERAAQAVLKMQRDNPSTRPVKRRSAVLGDLYADGFYLYPMPVPAAV